MSNLTPRFCKSVKPTSAVKSYGDGPRGRGLRLRVLPSGAKNWYQVLKRNGERITLGLGSYPDVSLTAARDLAAANHLKVKAGGDPRRVRATRSRKPAATAAPSRQTTLAECVEQVIDRKRREWKNPRVMERQWRGSLEHVAVLLAMPAGEVSTADALPVLERLSADVPTTARTVCSRLAEATDRAVLLGLRSDNPFRTVAKVIATKNGRSHHSSMPYADVPAAVAKLIAADSPKALAAAFQILTAARPTEAVQARWDEIDGDAGVWTIPGDRMKAGREHRVPLSAAAVRVLDMARAHARNGLVFPAPQGGSMKSSRLREALDAAGVAHTAHGFRSSFRDWCAESGKPREVAEAALAHVVRGVEGAYFRTDLFERRRKVMDEWGEYVAGGA